MRVGAGVASDEGLDFPSFSEGLSLREFVTVVSRRSNGAFPFLFGGTFIEGPPSNFTATTSAYFPSFSEGLSLRVRFAEHALTSQRRFPFLFGETFIEGR